MAIQIAHLAHHDHIGILTQRRTQGRGERPGVSVRLALGDVTTLRFEDVFNGILQCNDVFAPFEIHLLHQRGQGRRFSTSDRPGNED